MYSQKIWQEFKLVAWWFDSLEVEVETAKLKSANIIISHTMRNDIMHIEALLAPFTQAVHVADLALAPA